MNDTDARKIIEAEMARAELIVRDQVAVASNRSLSSQKIAKDLIARADRQQAVDKSAKACCLRVAMREEAARCRGGLAAGLRGTMFTTEAGRKALACQLLIENEQAKAAAN